MNPVSQSSAPVPSTDQRDTEKLESSKEDPKVGATPKNLMNLTPGLPREQQNGPTLEDREAMRIRIESQQQAIKRPVNVIGGTGSPVFYDSTTTSVEP